jgi:hypothetical protein
MTEIVDELLLRSFRKKEMFFILSAFRDLHAVESDALIRQKLSYAALHVKWILRCPFCQDVADEVAGDINAFILE